MQNTWWLMNFQGTVVILRSKFNMSSIWRFSFFFPATPPPPLQAVSLAPCPLFIFVGVLAWQFSTCTCSGHLCVACLTHQLTFGLFTWVRLAELAWSVVDEIRLGIIWEISAWFSETRQSQRSWVWVLAPNLPGHKANTMKHKNFKFHTYHSFGNS